MTPRVILFHFGSEYAATSRRLGVEHAVLAQDLAVIIVDWN